MKIITHNGHFHADELLAVAALLIKHPDAEVVRTRDEEVIKTGDIVVDVGHIYDPAKMRFDHHQPAGAGRRFNDIPYASFGLVWKEFGEELAGGKDESKVIEEKLVMGIDAHDNGISVATPIFDGIEEYSLGDFFQSFAEGAQTMEEYDERFRQALPIAKGLLKREIEAARRNVFDWKQAEKTYNKSENKKIIFLLSSINWKRILIPTEAMFVVYPRADGRWDVRAVPKAANSFEVKKPFPSSWGGLDGETLPSVSGVSDATFCHRDRWIAGAKTKEGAIKLAEIALNS